MKKIWAYGLTAVITMGGLSRVFAQDARRDDVQDHPEINISIPERPQEKPVALVQGNGIEANLYKEKRRVNLRFNDGPILPGMRIDFIPALKPGARFRVMLNRECDILIENGEVKEVPGQGIDAHIISEPAEFFKWHSPERKEMQKQFDIMADMVERKGFNVVEYHQMSVGLPEIMMNGNEGAESSTFTLGLYVLENEGDEGGWIFINTYVGDGRSKLLLELDHMQDPKEIGLYSMYKGQCFAKTILNMEKSQHEFVQKMSSLGIGQP